jgi:hypothetical protein
MLIALALPGFRANIHHSVRTFQSKSISATQVWREVSGQVYFAVLTFQLVMVALLALKQAPIVALLAAPLPVLTVALWRSAEVLFGPPQEVLSLEAAADLDRRDQVWQPLDPLHHCSAAAWHDQCGIIRGCILCRLPHSLLCSAIHYSNLCRACRIAANGITVRDLTKGIQIIQGVPGTCHAMTLFVLKQTMGVCWNLGRQPVGVFVHCQEHEAERRQMIEHGEFLESMYEAPPFRIARWDAASLPTEAAAVASGANRMGPAQVWHSNKCFIITDYNLNSSSSWCVRTMLCASTAIVLLVLLTSPVLHGASDMICENPGSPGVLLQDLEAQADSELPMMDDDDLYMDLYTEEFIDRKETAVQGSSRDKDEELPLSTPLLKRSSH